MPQTPPRPCRASACAGTTTERHGYCPGHEHLHQGWTRHQKGKSSSARGYGGYWRRLRRSIIQRDAGLCQPCRKVGKITPFDEVDHITPKAEGGTDSHENLQCICQTCHDEKTRQEALRARQGDA